MKTALHQRHRCGILPTTAHHHNTSSPAAIHINRLARTLPPTYIINKVDIGYRRPIRSTRPLNPRGLHLYSMNHNPDSKPSALPRTGLSRHHHMHTSFLFLMRIHSSHEREETGGESGRGTWTNPEERPGKETWRTPAGAPEGIWGRDLWRNILNSGQKDS